MATKTTATPHKPRAHRPSAPPQPGRFFEWLRAIDLPRRQGWIGGVCAGIAERIGVDPIIVRGIAVVAALLGGPAFLLYSVAWVLLPDTDGRIHLQKLVQGTVDRAMIGIVAVFLLGILPVSQGFWYFGAGFWGDLSFGGSVWRTLWTLLLIGVGIWLVAWLARRANHASAEPTITPATTDDRPDTVPNDPLHSTVADAAHSPTAPEAPALDASTEEIAVWREHQVAWKIEHDAWKKQQAATDRDLMLQRAAEAKAKTVAEVAARAERRRLRRLANPRMPGSSIAISLGVALLAGGLLAFLASGVDEWHGHELTVGFATAAVALALSMVVSGALRRRNGFVGFMSVLVLAATVLTSFVPSDRQVVGVGSSTSSTGLFAQPFGSFSISGYQISRAAGSSGVIDLWQGAGSVYVNLPADVTARVEITQRKGSVFATRLTATGDGEDTEASSAVTPTSTNATDMLYDETYGSKKTPDIVIRIQQGAGSVYIQQYPNDITGAIK